mgnify:FL=1
MRLTLETCVNHLNAYVLKMRTEELRQAFASLRSYVPKIRLEYQSFSSKDSIIFEKEVDRTPKRSSPKSTRFKTSLFSNSTTPINAGEKGSFEGFQDKVANERKRHQTFNLSTKIILTSGEASPSMHSPTRFKDKSPMSGKTIKPTSFASELARNKSAKDLLPVQKRK